MSHRRVNNYDILGHYTYFVPTVGDLVLLVVWFLVGALLGSIVSAVLTLALGQEAGVEAAMIASYPIMFIPPMIYASSRSRRACMTETGVKLDSSHFAPKTGLTCALVAMVLTLAGSFCADTLTALLPPMPEWLEEALGSLTGGSIWMDFICVSIFAPFFEEWLCRGMVLRGLLGHKVKPVWAIVISAAFFAIIHLNPWQAIPAFLLGCVLGYVYYKTGSLKLTMLMHFTNNTFALILGHIDSLEDMDSYRDLFPGPEFWLILVGCVLLLALGLMFYQQVKLLKPQGNCDEVPPIFES